MKTQNCRSKTYDLTQADVVQVELWNGQIIEVPVDNHKNWEVGIMNFICSDCANGTHTICQKQQCECQHRPTKPQVPPAE